MIKDALLKMFQVKFPRREKTFFHFVKREKNAINLPVVPLDFKWTFDAIKALMGQGKLCCRLNVPVASILEDEKDAEKENEVDQYQPLPPFSPLCDADASFNAPSSGSSSSSVLSAPICDAPGPSSSSEDWQELVNDLLNELDDRGGASKKVEVQPVKSLAEAISLLKTKMTDLEVKLRMDEEDALQDALAYYKKEFVPEKPLRIRFAGQPAVDTGGVLRHFYTLVFHQMVHGSDGIPPLFEGNDVKLPVYNTGVIVSNVMELVGKIIAHAIIQVGVGPICFSPAIFQYLVFGNVEKVVPMLTKEETSSKTRHYIDLVSAQALKFLFK